MFLRGHAQEIISLMDKTESAFRDNEQSISGDAYTGCDERRSTFTIMQIIRSIQEEYPDIRFHFFGSNADAVIERLDKGLLDMVFLLEPEITPRYDYKKLPLTFRPCPRQQSAACSLLFETFTLVPM